MECLFVPGHFVVIPYTVLVRNQIQLLYFFFISPAGKITLGDILEILPFEDPIVVLELDGESIWNALESSLSTWPAQEG